MSQENMVTLYAINNAIMDGGSTAFRSLWMNGIHKTSISFLDRSHCEPLSPFSYLHLRNFQWAAQGENWCWPLARQGRAALKLSDATFSSCLSSQGRDQWNQC